MYGLITTRTGLRLPLQSSFFHNSKAVIKCTSTISPGYWGSTTSSSSSSSINRGSSIIIHGAGGRKESLAQATRHHSVIDSREDTFIGEWLLHSFANWQSRTDNFGAAFFLFYSSQRCGQFQIEQFDFKCYLQSPASICLLLALDGLIIISRVEWGQTRRTAINKNTVIKDEVC